MTLKSAWMGFVMAALLAMPAGAEADSKKFRVKNDGGSKVTFTSDAPLETITGVSSVISGSLTVDPDDLSKTKGTFETPVQSLRTGVDLRDEHLHGKNWLDAKNHPKAHFEIVSVKGAKKLSANKDVKVKVRGKFTIHGITQFVEAAGTVRWIPLTDEIKKTPGITGDVLRIKSGFRVKLIDHGVSVPTIVRLKVSKDIDVSVDLRGIAE